MKRSALPLAAAVGLAALVVAGNSRMVAQSAEVQLDVVVTAKDGQPITDMKLEEFEVQDDGKKMTLTAVKPVSMPDGRTVVVLLDDSGVPAAGTAPIQTIADIFMSSAGPGDKISVVRIHTATDTLGHDRQVAAARIAAYRAGVLPYEATNTPDDVMMLLTKLAKQLQETAPGVRKAFVCLGALPVCNLEARTSSSPRSLYPNWIATIDTLAKTNTSVYAMIPARGNVIDGGVTDMSGGRTYTANTDFANSAREIWRDLSQYYVLTYTPAATNKDLRKIEVKTTRRGAIVRARTSRGK